MSSALTRRRGERAASPSLARQVAVVVLGAATAAVVFSMRGAPRQDHAPHRQPGDVAEVRLSLVASDRLDLACSHGADLGEHRVCPFDAEGRAVSLRGRRKVSPILTLDREVILLSDLFASPIIHERCRREPAEAVRPEPLQRFVVACSVRMVDIVRGVRVRWRPGDPWSPPLEVWLGDPLECRIVQGER